MTDPPAVLVFDDELDVCAAAEPLEVSDPELFVPLPDVLVPVTLPVLLVAVVLADTLDPVFEAEEEAAAIPAVITTAIEV